MQDENPEITIVVEQILQRWQEMRQGSIQAVADDHFRMWLLETLPAHAGSTPDDHCFLVFEVAWGLIAQGRALDAFTLLRWLGMKYVHHHDADVAARVIMALTDTCMQWDADDSENNIEALRVLRDVVDSAHVSVGIQVERALCRALTHIGYLRSRSTWSPSSKIVDLAALWTEINQRWRTSRDPELRGRAAQALWNKAILQLQHGDERMARREIAELTRWFGADKAGVSTEVDQWVIRAKHAPALLDQLVIPSPMLKTEYLQIQRNADHRRMRRAWGVPWLLGERNHMHKLIRLANERHRVSAAMVRCWVCGGEPFALLLRNFELTERSGTMAPWVREMYSDGPEHDHPDITGDHVRVIHVSKTQAVLSELVTVVPLVQVANTSAGELDVSPSMGQFVPPTQLYLPDATWFDTVTTLMALAEQVIVWAAELTHPLAQELTALQERDRAADTVVLLEERLDSPARLYLDHNKTDRDPEPLRADHPMLSGFPNVVPSEQLAGKQLHECPELMRLVARLDAARTEPIAQRMAQLRARLDAELAG